MAKDPAVLFYTSDFLSGTYMMSMEQRGKYITLLCLQHQQGHLSEKHMLSICSAHDTDVLCKFKQDNDGNYYNQRMELETAKRCKYTESRRKNASKKESICTAYEKHMPYHMENGNEDINKDVNSNKNRGSGGKEFDAFWSAYPKKVGKEAARKAFAKIPKSEIPNLVPAIENQKQSEQWKKDGGRYIPNPTTWLNQGRWQDELSPETPKAIHKSTPTLSEFEKLKQLKERMG